MAKPELGAKRQCLNCGTRFFDLNRSPILCPKCGAVFHVATLQKAVPVPAGRSEEDAEVDPAAPTMVPLEEADAPEEKVAAVADDDIEIEDDSSETTFLEEEEEDNDDVSDLIDGEIEDEEEA